MIDIKNTREIPSKAILDLYHANRWSAAEKPEALVQGLLNSHSLISAWDKKQLVGIGNAISDGHLVVYYPHLLVDPAYQGRGIGQQIMERMLLIYEGFHMQMLVADGQAIGFYRRMSFVPAGDTQPMWIYQGKEH